MTVTYDFQVRFYSRTDNKHVVTVNATSGDDAIAQVSKTHDVYQITGVSRVAYTGRDANGNYFSPDGY